MDSWLERVARTASEPGALTRRRLVRSALGAAAALPFMSVTVGPSAAAQSAAPCLDRCNDAAAKYWAGVMDLCERSWDRYFANRQGVTSSSSNLSLEAAKLRCYGTAYRNFLDDVTRCSKRCPAIPKRRPAAARRPCPQPSAATSRVEACWACEKAGGYCCGLCPGTDHVSCVPYDVQTGEPMRDLCWGGC